MLLDSHYISLKEIINFIKSFKKQGLTLKCYPKNTSFIDDNLMKENDYKQNDKLH
jgi:hypothetical protein